MKLSKRLQAILELSPTCGVMADIGSDHALLPVAFIRQGKAKRAIASDLSEKSLLKADRNIKKYGLKQAIEMRAGDGLSVLKPFEAGVIVISGLGGIAIAQMIAQGMDKINDDTALVLSPNHAAPSLRAALLSNGFEIQDEDMALENGRLYPLMLAKKGKAEAYSWLELEFGRQTIQTRHPLLKTYVEKRVRDAREMERTARMSQNIEAKAALKEAQRRLEEYGRLLTWL